MSFRSEIGFDAIRCLGIAVAATAIGWPLGRGRLRFIQWMCLLAPLLTPALLISYACAPIALRLSAHPSSLFAFYSALLVLKLAPIGAIARQLMPPSLSREASYCAELLPGRSLSTRLRFALLSIGPAPWVSVVFVFLCAFSDFELASLLSVKTWTVMLFDAHAGGIELAASLRRALLPLVVQLLAVAPVLIVLHGAHPPAASTLGQSRRIWPFLFIAGAISLVSIARVSWLAIGGLSELRWQDVFGEDLLVSLGIAGASAGLAWLAISPTSRKLTRLVLLIPGLLGALVLALAILGLTRAAWVPHILWNSPVSLLLAEVLLLIPATVLIRSLLDSRRPAESLHLARMAGSRWLLFDLAIQPRLAAFGLLFILAYFEFTAATILAPVGLTPVFARLHNLAHYGQSAILSAMLITAVLAPALLLALTVGVARLYARRDVR